VKKVLFINPFGIGDMIFSLYAVQALQEVRPGIRADLLCNERTVGLARFYPGLSRTYEFNRDRFRAVLSKDPLRFAGMHRELVSQWRQERYDALFDYSLGREFSFLGFLAGIPRRYGFDYKRRGFFLNKKIAFEGYEGGPVAETQLELLKLAGVEASSKGGVLGWSVSEQAEGRARILLKDAPTDHWMALAPGGGQSWGANAVFKQWGPEKFVQTAHAWAGKMGGRVLLLGDTSEKKLLEDVKSRLAAPCVLVCGEELSVVASLLKKVRFLLCNDGGLLHLAHSLGVRTVSLYGPVDEKVYGPYGQDPAHEVVTEPVSCRPCYSRFKFPPCPYEGRCLKELSVQKVLESVHKIA